MIGVEKASDSVASLLPQVGARGRDLGPARLAELRSRQKQHIEKNREPRYQNQKERLPIAISFTLMLLAFLAALLSFLTDLRLTGDSCDILMLSRRGHGPLKWS